MVPQRRDAEALLRATIIEVAVFLKTIALTAGPAIELLGTLARAANMADRISRSDEAAVHLEELAEIRSLIDQLEHSLAATTEDPLRAVVLAAANRLADFTCPGHAES